MNERLLAQGLGLASGGLTVLLGVGMIVVGLVYVRRADTMAGLCFAGAGALSAFAGVLRQAVALVFTFSFGPTLYMIVQVFATGLSILGGILVPVGIFLLANAVKRRAA